MDEKKTKKTEGTGGEAWLRRTVDRLRPHKTENIFSSNEQKGNLAVARTMLAMGVIYLLTLILIVLDIIDVHGLTAPLVLGLILQVTALTVYAACGPDKHWMKYVLFAGMILSLAVIDARLTYKTTLLIVIPVAVSIRYFSKKTTALVAGFTGLAFVGSAYWGAAHGLIDMNILPQDLVQYAGGRLISAVEELDLPREMLVRNTLILSCLPKMLLFIVVSWTSVQSADRGHQMILEQERISRVDAELGMAREIQMSNLPDPASAFPERDEFRLFASMDPAKAVGGDFYDFFLVDEDHLCLLIADVSDKGIPAALFMMSSKSMLRSEARRGSEPKELMETVNRLLCDSNTSDMFVTVWLGILEISTGKLTCVNAGHEYPFLRLQNGSFRLFRDKHGMMAAAVPEAKYTEYTLTLAPGDAVFVYTDGVPEANNAAGEMYGAGRLEKALNRQGAQTPTEILQAVRRDVDAFVGDADQFDDLTMLCMEYRGPEST